MQKYWDVGDIGRQLSERILVPYTSARINTSLPDDTYSVREHGIKAAEVVSPDMLIKQLGSEILSEGWDAKSQKRLDIFLCYNWKTQQRFIILEQDVTHREEHYSPQYGRSDNYVEHKWHEVLLQVYGVDDFNRLRPEYQHLLAQIA